MPAGGGYVSFRECKSLIQFCKNCLSKKIPTDLWNIPQTLNHLFMVWKSWIMFGNFGLPFGYVPRVWNGIFLKISQSFPSKSFPSVQPPPKLSRSTHRHQKVDPQLNRSIYIKNSFYVEQNHTCTITNIAFIYIYIHTLYIFLLIHNIYIYIFMIVYIQKYCVCETRTTSHGHLSDVRNRHLIQGHPHKTPATLKTFSALPNTQFGP